MGSSNEPPDLQDIEQYKEKVNKTTQVLKVKYTPDKCTEFPLIALNKTCRAIIKEISSAYSVPDTVPACAFLSLAGACIGRTRAIQIKESWKEYPNLWIVIVGDSGIGKSPVTKEIYAPIFDLEEQWFKAYQEARQEYEQELIRRKNLPKEEKASLGKPPEPPKYKQVIVDDATVEALSEAFQHNPRGILWYRDELAGLILDMDKYTKNGGTKQRLISAYDGSAWKVSRISKRYFIRHACLSIFGTIQPKTVSAIFSDSDGAIGFLPRFTFIKVKQEKPQLWTDEIVSQETREILLEIYKGLLAMDFQEKDKPYIIQVSEEAKEAWVDWYNQLAQEPWQDVKAKIPQAVIAKLKGQCPRVALILHCLEAVIEGDTELKPVSLETMQSAILIANYFKTNQQAIWQQVSSKIQPMSLNPLQERVARAVLSLQGNIKNGMLFTDEITEEANKNIAPYETKLSTIQVGIILQKLGFIKKSNGSKRGWGVTPELLESLKLSLR